MRSAAIAETCTSSPTITRRSGPPCMPSASTCTRSEEHTSELQSQSNLVCRLLLEEKIRTLLNPQRLKQQAKDKVRETNIVREPQMAQTTIDNSTSARLQVTDIIRA